MKKIFFLLISITFIISMNLVVFANQYVQNNDPESTTIKAEIIEQSLEQNIEDFRDGIADESVMEEAIYEREIEAYRTDPEFQKHYAEDPDDALKMIESNTENQMDFIKNYEQYMMDAGNEDGAWVDPILIMQKNSYYCGPCSALQAIAISGGYVAGSTNNAKQDTLASAMGTNSDGTLVYNVTSVLNSYVSGYSYKRGSQLGDFNFKYTVLNSLINGKAPILHARTGSLDYYNGHDTGHYICVTAINNIDNLIRLSDCNNNPDYYGTRSVPRSQAYEAISQADRYLISTSML